jgi:hypothetical protein
MSPLQDGPAGRRAVNAPLLASIIFASHADQAFVESVNARPGEGPTGAFAFGRREGVLAAAGVREAGLKYRIHVPLKAVFPLRIPNGLNRAARLCP